MAGAQTVDPAGILDKGAGNLDRWHKTERWDFAGMVFPALDHQVGPVARRPDQRVDDALQQLDVFIDGLLRDGASQGFVLHGHGTGALKQAVRKHLVQHRAVRRSAPAEPEDGGDAFTVLWLD
jgi:hypothetical protein